MISVGVAKPAGTIARYRGVDTRTLLLLETQAEMEAHIDANLETIIAPFHGGYGFYDVHGNCNAIIGETLIPEYARKNAIVARLQRRKAELLEKRDADADADTDTDAGSMSLNTRDAVPDAMRNECSHPGCFTHATCRSYTGCGACNGATSHKRGTCI
ncbi:hypothetical protein K461DRAFT_281515 [Myriangium duriaei CBS 260.36]|uniref:Uncharacterized protein n=1 Tax=Myriangium duriaei CBS 260.36 TaxID=1168546 RepID=A0A9P4MJZ4_9PEZI|nr:hypothetical protein K461DRAFT_281515 [Myriangium duriaei CBS 260.36]